MPKLTLKHPGNPPTPPKEPTAKKITTTTKLIETIAIAIGTGRSSTATKKAKLLSLLKNVGPDVDIDDLHIEFISENSWRGYDRHVKGTIKISSISKKPNPRYESTMARYRKRVEKYNEDKAEYDAKLAEYEKQRKAAEKAELDKKWARKKAAMKRKIAAIEGGS